MPWPGLYLRRQHLGIRFTAHETFVVLLAACATSAWHQRRLPLARDDVEHALEHACSRVTPGRHAGQEAEESGDEDDR